MRFVRAVAGFFVIVSVLLVAEWSLRYEQMRALVAWAYTKSCPSPSPGM